jgi:hypothetical protein
MWNSVPLSSASMHCRVILMCKCKSEKCIWNTGTELHTFSVSVSEWTKSRSRRGTPFVPHGRGSYVEFKTTTASSLSREIWCLFPRHAYISNSVRRSRHWEQAVSLSLGLRHCCDISNKACADNNTLDVRWHIECRHSTGIICVVLHAQHAMFAAIRKLVLTRVLPGALVASIAAYTRARILNGPSEPPKTGKRKRRRGKKERQ